MIWLAEHLGCPDRPACPLLRPQSEAQMNDMTSSSETFRDVKPRPVPLPGSFMPAWTWEELELALLCLPLPVPQRLAVPNLIAATRMASPYQSPIATLKEMVALVGGLGEDLERAGSPISSGEGASMP
jgi:hypothetical protein